MYFYFWALEAWNFEQDEPSYYGIYRTRTAAEDALYGTLLHLAQVSIALGSTMEVDHGYIHFTDPMRHTFTKWPQQNGTPAHNTDRDPV